MLKQNFGPWTTSLTAGSRVGLSAFWRNRLTRLPGLCAAHRGISLCRAVILAGAALLLTAAPHWQFVGLVDQSVLAEEQLVSAQDEGQPTEADASKLDARPLYALDQPTEVNFNNVPRADALNFLAEYHNITLRIDGKAIEAAGKPLADRPVTLKLRNAPFRTVLSVMLEPESLGYYIARGELVVTTREKSWAALTEKAYDIRSIAESGVSGAELAKGVQFVIAPASWNSAGGAGSLTVEQRVLRIRQRDDVHRQLRELLRELRKSRRAIPGNAGGERLESRNYPIGELQQAGMSNMYIVGAVNSLFHCAFLENEWERTRMNIDGDHVVVAETPASQHAIVGEYLAALIERLKTNPGHVPTGSDLKDLQFDLGCDARRRRINQQMRQTLSVDFSEIPMQEAIHRVVAEGGVDVWIDAEGLSRKGVSLAAPVTLKTGPASCSAILDQILEPLGLDWRFSDEIIKISADGMLEPRVYRMTERITNGGSGRVLAKRIELQIEPKSWTREGSNARTYVLPGSLLVMQSARVQRKIETLVESLSLQPEK